MKPQAKWVEGLFVYLNGTISKICWEIEQQETETVCRMSYHLWICLKGGKVEEYMYICLYKHRISPEGFQREWKHWNEEGKHWAGEKVWEWDFSLFTLWYLYNFVPNATYSKVVSILFFFSFFQSFPWPTSPPSYPNSLQNHSKGLSLFAIFTFSSLFSVTTLADISIVLILEKYKELARFLVDWDVGK